MRTIPRTSAVVALAIGSSVVVAAPAAAGGSSRAVVNVSGNNRVITFSGSTSGLGALQMAGNNVAYIQYGGQGVAVCSINGFGNPAVAGQCLGEQGDGRYWSYWRASPGAGGFSYSGQGAGASTVTDGWVEGWSFGKGSKPPFSSFSAVAGCAPPPTAPPPTAPPPTAASTGGATDGATGGATGGSIDGGSTDVGSGSSKKAKGSSTTVATNADGTPRSTPTAPAQDNERESGSDDERASATADTGSNGGGDGDNGRGTPLGIGIAAALVAAIIGVTVWRRRNERAANAE